MSQSLRLLLIADDPEVIRRIGQGLQRQDSGLILIEGADSLATAKRRLKSGSYDLALVDLALGHSDGLHLLSDLAEVAPELPVVALTADGNGPDAAACLALGAQDRLAPEAMDSAGLVDRLRGATARARAGLNTRMHSQRIAASLGATGDVAWRYEAGEDNVWLVATDPAAWQLPAAECRVSLDALRARLHPDDREMVVRQLEESLPAKTPWRLEARIKVGRGAYRWCVLRGRSQLDARGRLERASGLVSDGQEQQRRARELEQGRRFLRAVFDSNLVPLAVLDSSAIITECNQAWLGLDEPACHAGRDFVPGRKFTAPPERPEQFGDLDPEALRRGVKQVLGGVVERFSCEYGNAERRWRINVSPLLNPGIAGAIVGHEEITASIRADQESLERLHVLESDLRALEGPLFSVGPDFSIERFNEVAEALGRNVSVGRDVLKALPRAHADAVGDGLAALASGARTAVRDTRPEDGHMTRWLLAVRRDADDQPSGFVLFGLDVSDLVPRDEPAPDPALQRRLTELRGLLGETEGERERLGKLLSRQQAKAGELQAQLDRARQDVEQQQRALEKAERQAGEAHRVAEAARREVEGAQHEAEEARHEAGKAEAEARRLAESLEAERQKLALALEAERQKHGETLAALSAASQVPARIRAEMDRARLEMQRDLDELVGRVFGTLLSSPDEDEGLAAPPRDRAKGGTR
jgi:DNA-binding response OmpR family regulator